MGTGALVLVGIVVGRMRDLGRQLSQELTDRKRAEQALLESEQRSRKLAEEFIVDSLVKTRFEEVPAI